jgi:RNA polymerase sigma factor (TIGR02999 family)
MDKKQPEDVTRFLIEWSGGNRAALDALTPLVYDELRRMAKRYMRAEDPSHTLQPTALVHDAYLRLVDQNRVTWQNRAHFFAVAAQIIRRILVDHARSRHRLKRGGAAMRVTWVEEMAPAGQEGLDLVGLDEALNRLAELDPQQSRIIELRFFGGLSIEETAESLNVSAATVKREWAMARAWLFRELKRF